MDTKISIVGAKGFIGQNLSKKLSALNYELQLFTTSNPIMINKGLNPNALNSNVIIWCASKVNPISADHNSKLAIEELDYWQEFLKIVSLSETENPRIFFLSSGGCTYSGPTVPYSELDEARGTNTYGKHKLRMESALSQSGIDSVILRVANVYGPNQPIGRGQGVVAEWVNSISKSQPIAIYGDTSTFRDYIYIDDLLDAIVSILESNVTNERFNLGSGKATTLSELRDLFIELSKVKINSIKDVPRSSDRQGYFLDISKVSQLTGWTPKYDLRRGLQLCLN